MNKAYVNPAHRGVLLDRESGMYLRFDGDGHTTERVWAWSGTKEQAEKMRERVGGDYVFKLPNADTAVQHTFRKWK